MRSLASLEMLVYMLCVCVSVSVCTDRIPRDRNPTGCFFEPPASPGSDRVVRLSQITTLLGTDIEGLQKLNPGKNLTPGVYDMLTCTRYICSVPYRLGAHMTNTHFPRHTATLLDARSAC